MNFKKGIETLSCSFTMNLILQLQSSHTILFVKPKPEIKFGKVCVEYSVKVVPF